MRHLERAHNVADKWIHEVYASQHFVVTRAETAAQAADICTQPFGPSEKATWDSGWKLSRHEERLDLKRRLRIRGSGLDS